MKGLNLPSYSTKVISKNGKEFIWDILRQKYLVITPEEWVRQHFVQMLINHYEYPSGLMANEVPLTLNNTKRRCDTVVYDRSGNPVIIIEYKRTTVPLTQKVFDQISRYNIVMKVPYLFVSNGIRSIACSVDYENNKITFLYDIPKYSDL
ncbi:MAG: type I restriction enzyme HsdR N-terminal domain-containing protein [Bacteroidaceae bacterium]